MQEIIGDYLCPDCGSTTVVQHTEQREIIHADKNGEPESIDVETVEVNYAECADCGHTLIE